MNWLDSGLRRLAARVVTRNLLLAGAGALAVGGLVTAYALMPVGPRPMLSAGRPAPTAVGLAGRQHLREDHDLVVGSLATAAPAAVNAQPQSVATPFPFQAGVNLLVYGNDPAFGRRASAQLDHLAQLHVNSVSFVFPIYQDDWTATNIHADPTWTPSADDIRFFIRSAHQRHIHVLIRPLLDEASLHPAGKWRGQIAPSNLAAWFTTYTQLLVGYAQLAQADRAEIIDVGTEFDSLQSSPRWLDVIAAVRRVYSGQVTYSANWAIQYPAFGWAVDFISIDAFFPLAAPVNASQQQLATAWSRWIARANGIAYAYGKHVVFTELGTTAEVGSFQSPWQWSQNTGLSLEAQRRYYAASCQALKGRIGGIYWWEYLLQPLPSPSTDPSYDPEGKPADLEIGRCYA